MAGGRQPEIFRQLPTYELNWRAVVVSVAVHTVVALLVVCIPLVFFREMDVGQYTIVRLIAPTALPKLQLPRAEPKPRIVSLPMQMPNLERPKPEPVREPPKPKPKPPEPVLAETKKTVEPPKPAAPAPPKPEVKVGAFATAAAPTMKPRPAGEVQTGGFGVPYDAPKDGPRYPVHQLPAVGSFDLPVGPGQGNGTGGASGRPGLVASAGFGDARGAGSGGNGNGHGGNGGVRSAGFDDARGSGGGASAGQAAARDTRPPTQPVEILSKPKPEYTQAARDLRLEGEVLLEVLFTARGEIRVLRMIRGLGHGLDEAAIRAAQQIRFKPAMREGRPVDSNATVHIVFRLA